jgi:hypothetical protein
MCLNDDDLIRLIGGELSAQERDRCLEHLASCALCRQHQHEIQGTWDVLGQWQPLPPTGDLSRRILIRARRGAIIRRYAGIAAVLVLSAGAGVIAGLAVPSRSAPAVAQRPSSQEVVDAVGLDALAGSGPLLEELFVAPDGSSDEEARS